jgi:hypothetical protein
VGVVVVVVVVGVEGGVDVGRAGVGVPGGGGEEALGADDD